MGAESLRKGVVEMKPELMCLSVAENTGELAETGQVLLGLESD